MKNVTVAIAASCLLASPALAETRLHFEPLPQEGATVRYENGTPTMDLRREHGAQPGEAGKGKAEAPPKKSEHSAVEPQPTGAKRMECVQLAGAVVAGSAFESGNKLQALHTLRELG
jgi:hypothetical protein